MARPKMTAQRARMISIAMAQNAPQELGEEGKKLVKLEDGKMVHMRVKNPPPNSHEAIHGCVENDNVEEDLKPSLAVGSSSGNQSTEPVPMTPQIQQENGDDGPPGEQFKCTACGRNVHTTQVVAHPLLLVGVCTACYAFLFSSPFTKDNLDEHENECRWCGDGGDVVLCDFCPRAFCKACIERNIGASLLHAIESPTGRWPCFVCDNRPLQTAILEFRKLESMQRSSVLPQQKRKKIMQRSSVLPQQKRKKFSRVEPRTWSRSRSIISKTYSPDDTIATIIACEQVRMQRENPGKHFTGFDAPDPRRRRRPKPYRPAPLHDSNSEYDTSNDDAARPSSSDVAKSM